MAQNSAFVHEFSTITLVWYLGFIMVSSIKPFLYSKNNNISVRTIFKPLYVILSIFGFFPYSVRFDRKHGLIIIPKSIYLNSVCALSYILFMGSFLLFHIRYVYESLGNNSMTREVVTQMNYILELVVCFVVLIAAYVCVFTNRCIFVNIINNIANMIEPPNTNTERNLRRLRFKVNVIMLGFLLIVLLLQISVNFTREEEFWKQILVFVTFMLPQQMQFTVLCFYYLLILMLLLLLTSIRDKITDIAENKIDILECCLKANSKILTLQYVETLYVKALETKRQIVKAFEAVLLITTIQCFHSIVSESHIIYHSIVVEKDFLVHPTVNCSIWIIYQIIKIFILAMSGTVLKQELMRIGQALHNIPIDRHDIRLFLEIQHFSSLMAHQNSDITTFGLVTLDATLLTKIISSSAMYMIILVQFDKK